MKNDPFLIDKARLVYLVRYTERIRKENPALDELVQRHASGWYDIATTDNHDPHTPLLVDATRFDLDELMYVVRRMPDGPSSRASSALTLVRQRLVDGGFVATPADLVALAKAVRVYEPFRRARHAAIMVGSMIEYCTDSPSDDVIFENVLKAFINTTVDLPLYERGDIVLHAIKACQSRLKGLTKKFPLIYEDAGMDGDMLIYVVDVQRRLLGSHHANPKNERGLRITEAAMLQEALYVFAKNQERFLEIVNALPESMASYLVARLFYDGGKNAVRVLHSCYRDLLSDPIRDEVLYELCLQDAHCHWDAYLGAMKNLEMRREALQKAVNLVMTEDELKILFGFACRIQDLDESRYLKAAFVHACDTVVRCESEVDECLLEEDQLN